jgi:hypothetical protein
MLRLGLCLGWVYSLVKLLLPISLLMWTRYCTPSSCMMCILFGTWLSPARGLVLGTSRTILNTASRDVLEHFDDGVGEAAGASMDVGRLGEYLLRMVGHAVVRGSAGQSTKSW